jgi:uncharacterized protein (DUF2267 family)
MNYDTFIDIVAQRAQVPSERAVDFTRATLETLADRVTAGEAMDLAAQLPKPLRGPLRPREDAADNFGVREFLRRAGERAGGVDETAARNGVRAVFTTVREAITGGEFDDMMAQLPREFRDFVDPVALPAAARRR